VSDPLRGEEVDVNVNHADISVVVPPAIAGRCWVSRFAAHGASGSGQ
jgi:hypothetical protein